MSRTWKDTNPSALCWTQSDEMLLPLLHEYWAHYHQTQDPGCRPRKTSLSLALVDQEKHISPSEAFTDSCQPEHLVATVPDTVSRRETPQFSLGSYFCPSLCCLASLKRTPARPPLAAQTTVLWWGTRPSIPAPRPSAQGHGHCGIRIPEDWTQSGTSAPEVWLCQSPPGSQGRGRHRVCDQKRLQRQVDTTLLQRGVPPQQTRLEVLPLPRQVKLFLEAAQFVSMFVPGLRSR